MSSNAKRLTIFFNLIHLVVAVAFCQPLLTSSKYHPEKCFKIFSIEPFFCVRNVILVTRFKFCLKVNSRKLD